MELERRGTSQKLLDEMEENLLIEEDQQELQKERSVVNSDLEEAILIANDDELTRMEQAEIKAEREDRHRKLVKDEESYMLSNLEAMEDAMLDERIQEWNRDNQLLAEQEIDEHVQYCIDRGIRDCECWACRIHRDDRYHPFSSFYDDD